MTYPSDSPSATAAYNATALKILNTAAHLFMQLGYRAVSINDIVKATGVTKPTLYYYFPDKAELFTQMALLRLVRLNSTTVRPASSQRRASALDMAVDAITRPST